MDISFKGKRALVTGAAQGMGRGIAERLVKCGATVIAVDISLKNLEEFKKAVPSIEIMVVDLGNWTKTSETIKKAYPIDLLVNNAGVSCTVPLTEATEEAYNKTFDINIKALINVTKIVVENLLERKAPGAIVNISSQNSQAALVNHTIYAATKGAVDAFTRSVALDFGPNKIRINSVNPTVVMTALGRKVWGDPALSGPMLDKIPLQRFAEIDDVVDAVLFLLSDRASMITGSCLAVDGGFLAC